MLSDCALTETTGTYVRSHNDLTLTIGALSSTSDIMNLTNKELKIKEIAIAGGVSANKGLRKALQQEAEKQRWSLYIPDFQYCTDNAGMIAMAAHFKYLEKEFSHQQVSPMPRFQI